MSLRRGSFRPMVWVWNRPVRCRSWLLISRLTIRTLPTPLPSEPTESVRFRGLFHNLHSGLLEVNQRSSTHARAPNQFIPDALAQFIAVFVCRDLLADKIQGGRHVRNRG